jgi:hypothetical protein
VDGRALASLKSECLEGNDGKLSRFANTHGLSQKEADCIGVDDVGRQRNISSVRGREQEAVDVFVCIK